MNHRTSSDRLAGGLSGPGPQRILLRASLALLFFVPIVVGVSPPAVEAATKCPYLHTWEAGPGGLFHHARVTFRPIDVCKGKHVKRAAVKMYNKCLGWNSGWVWTTTAKSPKIISTYSREISHRDSLRSGEECTMQVRYTWDYF